MINNSLKEHNVLQNDDNANLAKSDEARSSHVLVKLDDFRSPTRQIARTIARYEAT